jgi:lipoprotein-releasing system ATP-binding protein
MNTAPVLSCTHLGKVFDDGASKITVLKEVSFSVAPGESIAIVGTSGSGKSTLLHLLGGLDTPTYGEVNLLGQKFSHQSDKILSRLRNQHLGFVYQFHHLLPEFTVLENVCLPLLIRGNDSASSKEQAMAILQQVGLALRVHHKIGEISGGERQRAAIARALVTKPHCLLADEPTGNLDQKTAHQVFDLILSLNQEFKTSLIIVTHDIPLAKRLNRILELTNGSLQ